MDTSGLLILCAAVVFGIGSARAFITREFEWASALWGLCLLTLALY